MRRLGRAALGLWAILLMAGCSQDVQIVSSVSVSEDMREAVASYSEIGRQHNRELEQFYFSSTQGSGRMAGAVEDYRARSLESVYGKVECLYFGAMDGGVSGVRNGEGATVVEALAEKELVGDAAAVLLARIERLLRNPLATRELMNQSILEIQELAVATLEGTELDQVMSYAETAKASLEFWSENYGKLTNQNEGWSIQKWWDTNKHRIAMMAVSDASGAAVGAIIGASVGSSVGGVGAGPGAGVGAVICGAASSIQGFKEDKFCVVIPWEQLKDAGIVTVQ